MRPALRRLFHRSRRTRPVGDVVTASSPLKRGRSIAGAAVIPLVAAAGLALTLQGWRSRIPAFDLLTYIRSIRDFLATGAIPAHGDIGSYGSFKPAGTAWLMLPSTVLFDDPRLSEYVGAALLYVVALTGLYLLARKYFGVRCAWVAVGLYGLSETGIFLAGSLWPNGRPEFLIWMVYLASQWVTRQDARFLAGAVAVWGIGMYVDMGITPAVFILPALWWVYRAPVRVKPLVAAAALVCLVWFPYLRFEASRGFADIRSQLTFNYILPADYKSAWCDPDLTLRGVGTAPADGAATRTSGGAATTAVASGTPRPFFQRLENAVNDKLLSNFAAIADVPGRRALTAVLFLMVALCAVLLSVTGARARTNETGHHRWGRGRATIVGLGMIGLGIAIALLGHLLGSRIGLPTFVASPIETAGKLLAVGVAAALVFRSAILAADLVLRRVAVAFQDERSVDERRLLVISLLVPWVILVTVAEPDKPERFWWLWGLQVLFLAAFATDVLPRLRAPRVVVWATVGVLGALLLPNGQVLDRVAAWRAHGWAGREAAQVRVVDYIADQLEFNGRKQASIGYRVFVYRFMSAYHIKNPDYKVGADFDLMLRYRRDVTNIDTCAEGFRSADEYRIVQRYPQPEEWAPRAHFDVPLGGDFSLINEVGSYQIYRRRQSPAVLD